MSRLRTHSTHLQQMWIASCPSHQAAQVIREHGGMGRAAARQRRGFTLIEMIISVGLVVVLMTAVWGLMSTFATLQTAGADATAEQQLVRSVMELLRHDLEALCLPTTEHFPQVFDPFAVFEDVEAVPASGDVTDRFGVQPASALFEIKDLQRNPHGGPASISIQGTPDVIRITIPRVPTPNWYSDATDNFSDSDSAEDDINHQSPDGRSPAVPEFHTIVYQLRKYGSAVSGRIPSGLYRFQTDSASLKSMQTRPFPMSEEHIISGPRIDDGIIEQLLFPPTNGPGDQSGSSRGARSCEWIPEVVGCRFQYYDGHTWHQNWTRDRSRQLPVAIRIALETASTHELEEWQSVSISDSPSEALEQQINRPFTGSVPAHQTARGANSLHEPQIVPRRYKTLILLDTAASADVPRSFDGLSATGGEL